MKLIELDTVDNYTNFQLEMSEEEEKELKELCEKNSITIEKLVESIFTFIVEKPEEAFKFIKEHRPDRCGVGTIGKPLFKYEDEVGFYIFLNSIGKEIFCKGKVYIVDSYGTFEQNVEPSYDIMVENFNNSGSPCLCKHIRESELCSLKFED